MAVRVAKKVQITRIKIKWGYEHGICDCNMSVLMSPFSVRADPYKPCMEIWQHQQQMGQV